MYIIDIRSYCNNYIECSLPYPIVLHRVRSFLLVRMKRIEAILGDPRVPHGSEDRRTLDGVRL